MLRLTEYPKGRYNLIDSDNDEGIYNLSYTDLELIRVMIEGVRVDRMPEPKSELHPLFEGIIKSYMKGGNK